MSLNANGHQIADSEAKGSGIAGESLALGDVIYRDGGSGKLLKYNANVEVECAAIIGMCDGSYALNAAMTYYQSGDVVTGLSGLTDGQELWANPSNGLASPYSSLALNDWTRLLGVAVGTTSIQLQFGEVKQRP